MAAGDFEMDAWRKEFDEIMAQMEKRFSTRARSGVFQKTLLAILLLAILVTLAVALFRL
jgi:hypothetical protein